MVRISGPAAGGALDALAGTRPNARHASYRRLSNPADGEELDHALVLWLQGPGTATGEDVAELHLHGGRAVVAAVLAALARMPGLRAAEAGEFTRRAFENGRIDLAEAEGLADLLAAETESQRRAALALAEGGLGRVVEAWQSKLLRCAAMIEAELDFSDEGDVREGVMPRVAEGIAALSREIGRMLASPPAERLRDGVRVVVAGPPNAGKSSLFNVLVDRDAAIVSEIAGTTRDRIEAPVVLAGVPLVLIDTAGLRESGDAIEAIGVARAEAALAAADIVLWLGEAGDAPKDALLVSAKSDLGSNRPDLPVSVLSGEGVSNLREIIIERAKALLPRPDALAINQRHRDILNEVQPLLDQVASEDDLLIAADHLRAAREQLNRITGRAGTEDMLDTLFGRFCIGK